MVARHHAGGFQPVRRSGCRNSRTEWTDAGLCTRNPPGMRAKRFKTMARKSCGNPPKTRIFLLTRLVSEAHDHFSSRIYGTMRGAERTSRKARDISQDELFAERPVERFDPEGFPRLKGFEDPKRSGDRRNCGSARGWPAQGCSRPEKGRVWQRRGRSGTMTLQWLVVPFGVWRVVVSERKTVSTLPVCGTTPANRAVNPGRFEPSAWGAVWIPSV
jgi:hypothetical protein